MKLCRPFTRLALSCALILPLLSGCNTLSGTPSMARVTVQPGEVRLGDTIRIEAEVRDKHALVRSMRGQVREVPELGFTLRDDGQAPDFKAGDQVWTIEGLIPATAPPGEYHILLSAFTGSKSPEPIQVRSKGQVTPLQTETVIKILPPQP